MAVLRWLLATTVLLAALSAGGEQPAFHPTLQLDHYHACDHQQRSVTGLRLSNDAGRSGLPMPYPCRGHVRAIPPHKLPKPAPFEVSLSSAVAC